jgi:hypothetical protein
MLDHYLEVAMINDEGNSIPWWKRQLVWGTATALVLAVVSALIDLGDVTFRLATVIAVSGTTLALAVDLSFRAAASSVARENVDNELLRNQRDISTVLATLGPLFNASDRCRNFVRDIVAEWSRVEAQNSLLLHRVLVDQEAAFRSNLHALSNGQFSMDRQTFLQFRSLSMRDLKEMRGISATNPEYWQSPRGLYYLARQSEAIKSGLSVKRIIVLSRDKIANFTDIVRQQLAAGVHLTIVIREEVELDDLDLLSMDRFVVIDKGGVRGALFYDSNAETHRISSDEAEIRKSESILETIKVYEQQPEQIYQDLYGAR